ncbi:uncharacterized protein LOC130737635 [Lotus japonicus]|uniref:uncharacterized protein LOC130737635 n=1 Tax=Lotus japonicus TaxID=34305 RepID=UPI00258898F6|nr:uncharacterized protein LOC130737635 [Lotus japonicus]
MRGLRNDIEESVRPLGIRVFQQLVEKAREVESMKNCQRGKSDSGGPIRFGQRPTGRGVARAPKDDVVCYKGNQKRHYSNECGKEIVCWKCQKPGHVERNCPNAAKAEPVLNAVRGKRPSTPGRVFAMYGEQATVTDDLIQGTCVIAGTSLMVLFDSGATHSFIAEECVEKLGLLTADLPFDLVATTPAADRLVTRTACLQCPLIYEDRKFLANLVCLGLKGLNVILGMDWLAQYHVLLDCANKAVVFPDSGVTDYLNSYTLGKGSPAFVNSIVAEAKNDGDVRNILVVQDFVDVFPEDVPGIPPVRETEFSIDIMPSTGPISMAPYRMAPAELTELAKQLEDLSSKGFIRPTSRTRRAQTKVVVTKKTKHVLVQRFSEDSASEQHDDADEVPDVEIDEAIDQSLEVFFVAATALDVAPNVGTQGGSPFVSASLITPLGNGDHEEEDDSASEKTPSVEVSVWVTPEPSSKKGCYSEEGEEREVLSQDPQDL